MSDLEKAARQALDAMGLVGADLVCGASSHHRRTDLHGDEDVCPIRSRWHDAFENLSRALAQRVESVELTRLNFTSMQDARELVDLMQRQNQQMEKTVTDLRSVLSSVRKELSLQQGESVLEAIRKLKLMAAANAETITPKKR